jgi:membrane-bound lytic murein transglycosylase A
MVAQDTGSAIVGPARADIYFGAGAEAAQIAGRLRHNIRFAILVPNALDPVAAGRTMPLPQVRRDTTAKPPAQHHRRSRHHHGRGHR